MDEELQAKMQFADAMLRNPEQPYKAALEVSEGDAEIAMKITMHWTNDKQVLRFKKDLIKKHGEEHFLPSKTSMLWKIYSRAERTPRDEDFVKLMKLAADMQGMIEKPGVTVNNNLTTNKVMVVPKLSGSDDDWQNALLNQQERLVTNE